MTDTQAGAPNGEEITAPGIRVLAQYTRDLSFENPRAPDSLRVSGEQPAIDIGVELNAKGRPDGLFEVELKLTVDAKKGGEQSFAIELVYGGLFELSGIPPEELEPVLMIEAPRFLFPFARRIIGDLSSDGGFPPFMLEPIDFAGIYQSRRAQAEGEGVVVGQA
ncbi:protein-export chaperone SecB [Caulobacter sp. NIBR1757]|uniref:protein-export chaperone SecB n=1 Tax=Caulobacter sp. NIBR1757 TaxID=3016000 RepID=UPI0022F0873E|nr:protein-export chaperone SecB [Caulobacter sp. NIBR1757]WGM37177.1 Protein-export protein SecB [Caulobacter sp. NIBR1757]